MGLMLIVKLAIRPALRFRLTDGCIGMQVHMLILHRTPESLSKDIVTPATLTVDADLKTVIGQVSGSCVILASPCD